MYPAAMSTESCTGGGGGAFEVSTRVLFGQTTPVFRWG